MPDGEEAYAPMMLISMPQLADPNFSRTVVLLCEYGTEGAFGLIVNRPMAQPAHEMVQTVPALRIREDVHLFAGGPVEPMRAWVLTSRPSFDEDATEVADGVFLSASPHAIRTALQSPPGRDVKVLVGYAGWSAGQLDEELAQSSWLMAPVGAVLKVVDGSTVSMPDSPANRRAYPAPQGNRWKGAGFPVARMVALFSLAVGTVLDVALGPFQGQQTGETALFRTLHDHLGPGDVLLADRYYCSYFEIALLAQRGCAVVFRLHQRRRADFRRGRRLGHDDRLVVWTKPKCPSWLDEATYARLPDTVTVRLVRIQVRQEGFRTRSLVVATTLLDPAEAPGAEVAELYRLRWHAELDLRSLKAVMQMGILRCQSPAMVGKEVWAHLLAYNLIRGVMAQVAAEQKVEPLAISFKATLQVLNAFAPLLLSAAEEEVPELCRRLREAIGRHRVGDRPDRYEPRAKRRRPNPNPPPLNGDRLKLTP